MIRHLADLQHHAPDNSELVAYLLAQSNLPGKRGNLELAFSFAEYIEEQFSLTPKLTWTLCEALISENPPGKHITGAEEFLPFCGVLGLGRIGKIDPGRESDVLVNVKIAAQDIRWRIREAAAFAIQDLIDVRPWATLAILQSWVQEDNYLLHRAVVAGIAEPRFMRKQEFARIALAIHQAILERVVREANKRDPDFMVLVKGLCYSLSVVIVGIEQEGFSYLENLIDTDQPIIRKIVRENLKKNRLLRLNAEKVAMLKLKLDQS